jgi:alkylation response protein AidB-like acyl-CoA dehydrogenase
VDFNFSDEQQAVREAISGVLGGRITPDRVREVERSDERFDRELWADLAKADLLGLVVPESHGGGGYGMVELSLMLEAQGRTVAPVPLWATLALGVLPLAEFGSSEATGCLGGVASGEIVLTAALTDVASDLAVGGTGRPAVTATAGTDGSVVLEGTAFAVPYAHVADHLLVPAAIDGGVVVAVVPRSDVRVEWAETTNREIHPHVHFDSTLVPPAMLLAGGDPGEGPAVVAWMLARAWTGLCALQVGVAEAAVEQTALYLNTREQFGRPLSTFQGTMLRVADAAIDTESMRVTLWQAAWQLDHGIDADDAVAVAAWFAAEAGQRVVLATQHLHGGMGADIEYPIHRYFLWGKQIELLLGPPSAQLARLGRQLMEMS